MAGEVASKGSDPCVPSWLSDVSAQGPLFQCSVLWREPHAKFMLLSHNGSDVGGPHVPNKCCPTRDSSAALRRTLRHSTTLQRPVMVDVESSARRPCKV